MTVTSCEYEAAGQAREEEEEEWEEEEEEETRPPPRGRGGGGWDVGYSRAAPLSRPLSLSRLSPSV